MLFVCSMAIRSTLATLRSMLHARRKKAGAAALVDHAAVAAVDLTAGKAIAVVIGVAAADSAAIKIFVFYFKEI